MTYTECLIWPRAFLTACREQKWNFYCMLCCFLKCTQLFFFHTLSTSYSTSFLLFYFCSKQQNCILDCISSFILLLMEQLWLFLFFSLLFTLNRYWVYDVTSCSAFFVHLAVNSFKGMIATDFNSTPTVTTDHILYSKFRLILHLTVNSFKGMIATVFNSTPTVTTDHILYSKFRLIYCPLNCPVLFFMSIKIITHSLRRKIN